MAKKSWVTTIGPVLCHWCKALRIRGCGIVLNSTERSRFTTAGHLQNGFWANHEHQVSNRLQDLAWLWGGTTDVKRSHVPLFRCRFAVCLTDYSIEFRPRTFTIEFYRIKSIRSKLTILDSSFPVMGSLDVFQLWTSSFITEADAQMNFFQKVPTGVEGGGGGGVKYSYSVEHNSCIFCSGAAQSRKLPAYTRREAGMGKVPW